MRYGGALRSWIMFVAVAATSTCAVADTETNTGFIPREKTPRSTRVPALPEYPDVPSKHWAASSVAALSRAGYFQGYPDGTFRGDKPLTRYEWAYIQANINIDRFFPAHEQGLKTDMKQILERLTALEKRFTALEDRIKAADTPAALSGLPQPELSTKGDLQLLHSEFRAVTNAVSSVMVGVDRGEATETPVRLHNEEVAATR